MKVLFCDSYLTPDLDLVQYLNYDLVVFNQWSMEFNPVLDYQNSRKKAIQKIFHLPESYFSGVLLFGEPSLKLITQSLNPKYQYSLVPDKLSAFDYASFIKNFKIPVATIGYSYFHDLYFHILGLNFIPSIFSKWWESYESSSPLDLVLSASIVEWTTLKGLSPVIEDLFSETKWSQLELFFSNEDRKLFNAKSISNFYNQHPEVKKIISQWHQIKP